MPDELAYASAVRLAELVRRREVSPVELVERTLARIEQLDPALNSIVTLDADGALAAAHAAAAQAGASDAPSFLGVPIAIKDLSATAGLRTTLGTASLADWVPDDDDEHVARIRRAGFVIVGKTNTCELGAQSVTESALLGTCRNPWDPRRTPGGSSGGAAAAVAAGLVPVAQGSDGGGSIRIPASCCGLVGLKPARGRISNAPRFGDQFGGLSTQGPLGRHVADVAALLDVMRGYVPGDPHWAPEPERPYAEEIGRDPGRLRVGLVTTTELVEFNPEVRGATEAAGRLLTDLGHGVEPITLPVTRSLLGAFATLWTSSLAAVPAPRESLEPFTAALAEQGATRTAPALLQAIIDLQRAARTVVSASMAYDVVLSPTLAQPPLEVGAWDGLTADERFAAGGAFVGLTPVANMTGQPAISLPLGTTTDGLPIGVMATGRPADEALLVRLAAQLEAATEWTTKTAPLGQEVA